MRRRRILLIDDELYPGQTDPAGGYMWYYVQALRDLEFEVKEATGPAEGRRALSEPDARFDLIIIDMMMPPGNTLSEEATLNGMRSGLVLAKDICEHYATIPILILTNRAVVDTSELGRIPTVKAVLPKLEYTPFKLGQKVLQVLEH